ncbi:MAG: AEC family transporter [Oscillospiraceae bacterium]|nr:AEC family transporter [Oscillospiraceae bacterium]MDY3791933.1 AEC family transporter [Oscillospiraceae bacterium]MDY6208019.1 AEC family transporter [Oscillospiraceae bacterium]
MELSLICVKQIAVMFILVSLGILCGKKKLINKETNSKLSSFVLEVVNPVLIFMSYQQDFNTQLLLGLGLSVVLGFISYGIMIFLVMILYRKNHTDEGRVEQFAAVYSNCAFMGIPLINGLFGAEGVFYLTGYVTVFNIMVWTHGVISFGGKEQKTSLKKVLTSPAIIATVLGLVTFLIRPALSEIPFPAFIKATVGVVLSAADYVGSMNTPLAMLCAGVTISETVIGDHIRNIGVYRATFLRLIVCPVLFWLIFRWFPIPHMVFMVVMAAAGCPAAATGTMFAIRYKKCPEMAAVIFAVTTLLSAVTLPMMVMLGSV